MTLKHDLLGVLHCGTPVAVAFISIHSAIYGVETLLIQNGYQQFIENHLAVSRRNISEGRLHCVLFFNAIHISMQHLVANTVFFIPFCYRLMSALHRSEMRKSNNKSGGFSPQYEFWSIYIASGLFCAIGEELCQYSYKRYLLFHFRGNSKMITEINTKYDALNQSDVPSAGASGSICGLIGFNLLISMELIGSRIWKTINLWNGDKILDPNEMEENGTAEDDDWTLKYEAIKFGLDSIWMVFSGILVFGMVSDIKREWKFARQQRGNRDILKSDPVNQVTHRGHLCGFIGGMIMYAIRANTKK